MRKFVGIVGFVVAVIAIGSSSPAQIVGNARPITIVVPYLSGASVDSTIRLLTRKISEHNGQSFTIENRSGGGGVPAALAVMAAKPDGTTLFHADLAHVTLQALTRDVPFELNRDFEPITTIWTLTYLLAVPADSPVKTVSDIVNMAKQKPGGVTFASPGVSTGPHLLPEMMRVKSGGRWTHVPYRGAGPAMIDLIAGRVDMMYVSYASIKGFLQQGKLRVIAIVAPERSKLLPDAPTMIESGFPEIQLVTWFGLVAPLKTPSTTISALHQAFVRGTAEPEFTKAMHEQGILVTTISPSEFRKLIARDGARLRELATAAGLSPQ